MRVWGDKLNRTSGGANSENKFGVSFGDMFRLVSKTLLFLVYLVVFGRQVRCGAFVDVSRRRRVGAC